MKLTNLKKITSILLICVSVICSNANAALIDVAGLTHLWSGEGNANDSVGTANGTLGSTTTFATGYNGQAFSFDGQQSSIATFPLDIGPITFPEITIGMYINVDSIVSNKDWILGHDNGGYDRALMIFDSRFGSGFAATAGALGPYSSSLSNFNLQSNLGTWFGIAVAYNQNTNLATVYINDLQGSSAVLIKSTNLSTGLNFFSLGGLTSFSNHTVNALADELFIYNRALTQEELDIAFTQVPEPSTLAILALGILGLGVRRLKK